MPFRVAVFSIVLISGVCGGDFDAIAYPDDLHMPFDNHQHQYHPPGYFHHHHQEHPAYGAEQNLQIPALSRSPSNHNGNRTGTSLHIPLQFIETINKYNVSDLLLHYIDGDEEEDTIIQNRFGGDDSTEERSIGTMAKPASCMPELTTIKLATSNDSSVLYIPQCTRVERCGGCCSHSLLSCQPTAGGMETITVKVIKTQYTGAKKLKYLGTELIPIEKHTDCKCDCKTKAEDCNAYQEYRKAECRCACKNLDEEKKCYKNTATKLWDPNVCACRCRDVSQCSTGSTFDQNECRCIGSQVKRRYAHYSNRNRRMKYDDFAVVPLQ